MSKDLSPRDPKHFGLSSFADLLSSRTTILGEDPGTFEQFREGLMGSLKPLTPYECVIAESLVSIEWELFQRRRMREAALMKAIRHKIVHVFVARERVLHELALDKDYEDFVSEGGEEDDWSEPFEFDRDASEEKAEDLARRVTSQAPKVRAKALDELAELELSPIELMGDAYGNDNSQAAAHDDKIRDLERRRREVMRDYEALQKARPLLRDPSRADITDAEVIEQ